MITGWSGLALARSLRFGTPRQPASPLTQHLFSSSSAETAVTSKEEEPVVVACVLERLPVLLPPLPEKLQSLRERIQHAAVEAGRLRDYAALKVQVGAKEAASSQGLAPLAGSTLQQVDFKPVPAVTAADASGDRRTMRRRLSERLFLLVQHADGSWAFPQAANAPGDSVRSTAEQALRSALGSRPVVFIGNGPMGHLPADAMCAPAPATFFMLAQVTDDPWDVELEPSSGAKGHAWVTKPELLQLVHPDLQRLASAML